MNIEADRERFNGEAGAENGAVMVYGKLFFCVVKFRFTAGNVVL